MKIQKMLLSMLFVTLFSGWVQNAWAEAAWTEFSFDEQAAKQAYPSLGTGVIPQTPEELVLALKGLIAHRVDEDGEVLAERWLGLPRKFWVQNPLYDSDMARVAKLKKQGVPVDHVRINKSNTTKITISPPPPFSLGGSIDHEDHLSWLSLSFYKNPEFSLTPALLRKHFGPPTSFGVGNPIKGDNSWGTYTVSYSYSVPECFRFRITFRNKAEIDDKTEQYIRFNHTKEQVEIERERRRSFAVHKDYIPGEFELFLYSDTLHSY